MAKVQENIKAENPNALKHMFGAELLKRMGKAISKVYPSFDEKSFLALEPKLAALEMKPRMQILRNALYDQLPKEFKTAVNVLLNSTTMGDLNGFDVWPYTDFVQTHGLEEPQVSLDALKRLTKIFTAEFAVRPFLKRHPELTLKYLMECAHSTDVDLRRWASEGTRPRLPWGERLHDFIQDPSRALSILECLKFDDELYVRKSVSNHLNDIAKDHPDLVIATLTDWKEKAGILHAKKIDWIIHRSLRSLIKAGHGGALKLIGVSPGAKVEMGTIRINKKMFRVGDRLDFQFNIRSVSSRSQNLVIDYILHFVKSNQKTSPKVFKLKNFTLLAKAEVNLAKSHHLRKITTREYYPGIHRLAIQVNGVVMGEVDWKLIL